MVDDVVDLHELLSLWGDPLWPLCAGVSLESEGYALELCGLEDADDEGSPEHCWEAVACVLGLEALEEDDWLDEADEELYVRAVLEGSSVGCDVGVLLGREHWRHDGGELRHCKCVRSEATSTL